MVVAGTILAATNQEMDAAMTNDARFAPARTRNGGMPGVRGKCPACGWHALFVGENGYLTCSISDCPDPGAAGKLLADNR